jgi:hypothetical protein
MLECWWAGESVSLGELRTLGRPIPSKPVPVQCGACVRDEYRAASGPDLTALTERDDWSRRPVRGNRYKCMNKNESEAAPSSVPVPVPMPYRAARRNAPCAFTSCDRYRSKSPGPVTAVPLCCKADVDTVHSVFMGESPIRLPRGRRSAVARSRTRISLCIAMVG